MGLSKEIQLKLHIKEVERIDYFDNRYYKLIFVNKEKKLYYDFLDSVTEILSIYPKKGLDRWRGEVGNERADQIIIEAFNLGSVIHNGAEVIAKKGAVIYNPIYKPKFNAKEIEQLRKKYKNNITIIRYPKEFLQLSRILELFRVLKPKEVECEQTVYSLIHRYAGTLDLFFYLPKSGEYNISGGTPLWLDKGYYVADYKTGKYIDKTYKMQLSAYMEAIFEGKPELRKELRGGLIIHANNEKITAGIPGLKVTHIPMFEQKNYFNHFLATLNLFRADKSVPNPKELSMPLILTLN